MLQEVLYGLLAMDLKMNNPALKGEVSINKMLSQTTPRLRRIDIVSNSFASCVSDATEEFSRAPEMSFSEIISQPRMLLQKTESAITFKQLKSLANTHCYGHLNEDVDMINSDVKFINFESFSVSNLPDKEFTIHLNPIKLHRVHGIFAFPHEVKSILSKGMIGAFQIHFLSPEYSSNYTRLFNSGGLESSPSSINRIKFYKGSGNSSLGLKAEVSLPRM